MNSEASRFVEHDEALILEQDGRSSAGRGGWSGFSWDRLVSLRQPFELPVGPRTRL
jgi:hypothetical protein